MSDRSNSISNWIAASATAVSALIAIIALCFAIYFNQGTGAILDQYLEQSKQHGNAMANAVHELEDISQQTWKANRSQIISRIYAQAVIELANWSRVGDDGYKWAALVHISSLQGLIADVKTSEKLGGLYKELNDEKPVNKGNKDSVKDFSERLGQALQTELMASNFS